MSADVTLQLARRIVGCTDPVEVGDDLRARICRTLGGEVCGRWDLETVARTVAAAAAEACALHLDADGGARALAIAATQATGLPGLAGTWLGEYQHGEATERGREAAQLAAAGLTAPLNGLEGRRGLFALLAPGTGAEALLQDRTSDPVPGGPDA